MKYEFKLATAAVLHEWLNKLLTAPFHVECLIIKYSEKGPLLEALRPPMVAETVRIVASAHWYVLS